MGTLWDWFVGMQWQLPATPRGVLIGLLAGIFTGMLLQTVRERMSDVRRLRKNTDLARTARWSSIKTAVGLGLVALIAVVFMIGHDKPAAGQTPRPPGITGGR